jgi:dipeptidyl aminopeptidase/acylaminoacyl peptidase
MTTEPRDPRVRQVVLELLRAAPAAPPLPDVDLNVIEEPAREHGRTRRLRAIAATVAVLIVAATVTVVALVRRPSPRRAPITTPTTTVAPGQGAAPDVAFIDRRGLVVRARGSDRDVVVATGAVSTPLWSPDGVWLAFAQDNALWVVQADGSHRQRLSGSAGPNYESGTYAWSPALEALAVVDGAGVRVWWFGGASARSVLIVPPVGGFEAGAQGLAWSRGGSSLGISMERRARPGPGPGEASLWLAVGVCTPVGPLVCDQPRSLQRLAFKPGPGEYPIFVAGVAFDNNKLLVWPDAGGSGSVVQDGLTLVAASLNGGPTVTIATTLVRTSWVQPSPNGSRLLIVRSNGRMVTDPREVDLCDTPTNCRAVAPGKNVQTLDPAWSPDGRRIAYVREPASSSSPPVFDGNPGWSVKYATRSLWVANADGSHAVEITAAGGGVADPQFAPDGRSIVFVRDARLWQIDLTTERVTSLSGSMRITGACTTVDNCLPDVNVYESTSLWSDHEAIVFPPTPK